MTSRSSRRSDVSVASIKYYLREGLLAPGVASSVNQSTYGDSHLARLRLIRAMIDIAGVSVASARRVIEAIESTDTSLTEVFGVAQTAASQSDAYLTSGAGVGRERVDSLAAERGWQCWDESPGSAGAANVVDAFIGTGHPELVELTEPYAEAAEIVARADLRAVQGRPDVAGMAETVVVGTVLGDALFAALRRMAQVAITAELYPQSNAVPSATHHPQKEQTAR